MVRLVNNSYFKQSCIEKDTNELILNMHTKPNTVHGISYRKGELTLVYLTNTKKANKMLNSTQPLMQKKH